MSDRDTHADMAAGLYDIETLRVKLIVGRVIGVAIGGALWWVVAAPAFDGEFIPTAIALVALLFGGLWIGQMVTLSIIRGRTQ